MADVGGFGAQEGGHGDGGDLLTALRSAQLPDTFWMEQYKVLPCPHGYRHSWTHCPFAHQGETARRRPPSAGYSPEPCPLAKSKRPCPNGDACPYSHNTFEQWLHPARYRTRLCYLGANCRRPTCFFAHSVEELRSVEEGEGAGMSAGTSSSAAPAASTTSGAAAALDRLGQLPLPVLPPPPPLPSGLNSGPNSGPNFGQLSHGSVDSASTPALAASPALPSPTPMGQAGGPGAAAAPMAMLQPMMLVSLPQAMGPPPPPPPPHHNDGPPSYRSRGGPAQPSAGMMPPGPSAMPGASPFSAAMMPGPPHGGPMQFAAVQFTPGGAVFMHQPGMPVAHMAASPPMGGHPGAMYSMSRGAVPHPMGAYYTAAAPPPGVAPAGSRTRSWSTPGENLAMAPYGPGVPAAEPPRGAEFNVGRYSHGPGHGGSHPHGGSSSGPVGRSVVAAALHSGPNSGPNSGPAMAPRHMPTPTNRTGASRRMSMPASSATLARGHSAAVSAAAAAAATAAVAATAPLSAVDPSNGTGSSLSPPAASRESMEAALRQLAMASASPIAPSSAPPAAGGSEQDGSRPAESPRNYTLPPRQGSSSLMHEGDAAGATYAAAVAEAVQRLSFSGAAVGGIPPSSSSASVARSSSVNFPISPSAASGVAAGADAAAAALAAVAAAAGVQPDLELDAPSPRLQGADPAAASQYRALLNHVLRSTSASAAESSPSLSALLSSAGAGAGTGASADADAGDDLPPERSSDPHLRAAMRRLSSEVGYAMAASRNSDPGQTTAAVTAEAAGKGGAAGGGAPQAGMQILLPLLQTILNEGLASGQLELVKGQLHFRSAAGAGGGGAGAGGGSAAGSGPNSGSCVAGAASGSSSSGGGSGNTAKSVALSTGGEEGGCDVAG